MAKKAAKKEIMADETKSLIQKFLHNIKFLPADE